MVTEERVDGGRPTSVFGEALRILRTQLGASRAFVPVGSADIAADLGVVGGVEELAPDNLVKAVADYNGPCLAFPAWIDNNASGFPRDFWTELGPVSHPLIVCLPAQSLNERIQAKLEFIGNPVVVLVGNPEGARIHPAFRVAAVAYSPETMAPSVTRFFVAPERRDPLLVEEARTDFERLLRQGGGKTTYGFVHRGSSLVGRSLEPLDYDPRIEASIQDLSGFGSTSSVQDVFEVLPGVRRDQAADIPDGRLLTGSDITKGGELRPLEERVERRTAEGRETSASLVRGVRALRDGDFLVRDIHPPSGRSGSLGLPVIVREEDLPLWANDTLVVLRPRRVLATDEQDFYRFFLGSRRCWEALRLTGLRVRSVIREAPLPRPDSDLLEAIGDVRKAQAALQGWIEEGAGLTLDAFDGAAADARNSLIERGRMLRQRVEAGQRIGTLDNRIATFYPYPIAHHWRVVRAAEGAGDDRAEYSAILDCFEATLAFAAALALTFAHQEGLSVKSMDEVRRKLGRNGSGPTLGDWTNILKEVSSGRAFRRVEPEAPLAVIREALPEGSPAAEAQERLSKRRNDESHQRRVDPLDLPDAIKDAKEDLQFLLEHLGFLSDLPILQVRENRWDSITGRGILIASVLQGDHPVAPTTKMEHVMPGLEIDSLYVRDISGDLVLLRPFLVRHQCPRCSRWSTFHPDRFEQGKLLLKAVDHAHTTDGEEHRAALTAVGYLP